MRFWGYVSFSIDNSPVAFIVRQRAVGFIPEVLRKTRKVLNEILCKSEENLAARGFAARCSKSAIIHIRVCHRTLGKQRDCSQSN